MANILSKTFESDTTDAEPSGITKWDGAVLNTYLTKTTRPFTGSRGLLMTGSGNHHAGFYYTADLSSGDYTYEGVFNADVATSDRFGLSFRVWDDAGTKKGYFATLRGGNSLRLSKFSNTTESVITTLGISAISLDTWYHLKVYVNGSTIKVKYWADGGGEPGTWDIDTTDTGNDNTRLGVGVYLYSGNVSNLYYVDDLSADDFSSGSAVKDLIGVGMIPFAR